MNYYICYVFSCVNYCEFYCTSVKFYFGAETVVFLKWLGYRPDNRLQFPGGTQIIFSPRHPNQLWRSTVSFLQWVQVWRFLGNKAVGAYSWTITYTSATVESFWTYASVSPYNFVTSCLIMCRNWDICFPFWKNISGRRLHNYQRNQCFVNYHKRN